MNTNNNNKIDSNLVINPGEFNIKDDSHLTCAKTNSTHRKFIFKTPKSKNGAFHEFELSSNNSLYEYWKYYTDDELKNKNLQKPLNQIPAFLQMKNIPTPIKRKSKKFWISTQQKHLRTSDHIDINDFVGPLNHIFYFNRIEYSNYTIDMNSYNRIHNLESKENIQKISRSMPHIKTRHSFYITENDVTIYEESKIKDKNNLMAMLYENRKVIHTYTDLLTKCRNKNFDSILNSYEDDLNNYFENITQKHNPQMVQKKSFLDKLKDIFN